MTTVVADKQENAESNGTQGRMLAMPSTSVIGLTPGGGWVVSPCSAPSGAKRSSPSVKLLQYLLLWHLETGRQS